MKPGDLRVTRIKHDNLCYYREPTMRRQDGRVVRSTYMPVSDPTYFVLLSTTASLPIYMGVRFWTCLSRYGIVYVQEANLEALTDSVTVSETP